MIIQEAVDISVGRNFVPNRGRYRLPVSKEDTSVFLLSDSFEYDIELIKKAPSPKAEYKNIIIPYRIMEKVGNKSFKYNVTQNEYMRRLRYMNDQKLLPKLTPLKQPYPPVFKGKLYVSLSDMVKNFTPILRTLPIDMIKDNVFMMFNQFTQKVSLSKEKVLIIDTKRFRINKSMNNTSYHSDIINALLASYVNNPSGKIKRIDWVFIFRNEDADYKFDMRTFEDRDVSALKSMLNTVGSDSFIGADTDEEAGDSMDSFVVSDEDDIANDEKIIQQNLQDMNNLSKGKPIDDESEDTEEVDIEDNSSMNNDPTIQSIQSVNKDVSKEIRSSINSLSAKYGINVQPQSQLMSVQQSTSPLQHTNSAKDLYNAKTYSINAKLLGRINPSTNIINTYDRLNTTSGDSVEDKIRNDAKSQIVNATENQMDIDNTTTSPRELKIRKQVGELKLNNVTFDKIVTTVDSPLPEARKPRKLTTTNAAALKGTSFAHVAKEYEDKLLDRDIVATFMNLSTLPDGFYVANVEVSDISTVTSLMNNWRVTLKNKITDKSTVINIKVPKVINGRFYNNGIWYNIGKQDFPIPVLKINKKKVILTSNYNKITVDRYDTRSLLDVGMFVKIINKELDAKGNNKYVEVGSSVNTNSRYISSIEYDEYSKCWKSFINKEMSCEVYFNRDVCKKAYSFVNVNEDEFCCGMLNQVPVVINVETGMTRQGKTLTETLLSTLPQELVDTYMKSKPGKLSMYAQIKIGQIMPLGVAIAAWEGLSTLIRKSGAKTQFVEKRFSDPRYFIIPFKDKNLAIPNTTINQLIFNGFYRVATKAHNVEEFEVPIMNSNSIYVDIFNQNFFKQYAQLTTFITYYNFFVDAITKDVCDHFNIPNDISGMLIYAAKLLADNNFTGESNSSLYRIRSSEIIPAIIHYRLAVNISKWNNQVGSKSRENTFTFNPNEVLNELFQVPNVEPLSSLNPMVELHLRENITKKGFSGMNDDRAFNLERRSYESSMIGKIAMSTPNAANTGIVRQLVADPKITSVRGYTSTTGEEGEYNDLQLASFSELLTPGTISRDDAIRNAIATSQTSHIVPTLDAQPVLISNGVDEIVPAYLTDEFSVLADEDGVVLEVTDDFMIVQYKSGKKRAINIGHRQSFNAGSGFYVDNKLATNFQQEERFKKDDILAYHERYFSKDSDGIVRMNIGPLAKVAFTGIYSTYEDAGIMTHKMSKRLSSKYTMVQKFKLNAFDDIERIVKVGDEIEIGDPLIVFGLGDTGDKAVDNFLKAFQSNDILESAKRIISSKEAGTVVDVRMYTCKSMEKLSPSLYKLLDDYFKENLRKRKILDKHEKEGSVYKMGMLYDKPTEPLKGSTIMGITCDVLIEIFIEHTDEVSVGDKCVAYAASKQIISEVVPEGLEPYSEHDPDEEISMFVAPASILKRMIPSVTLVASANKVLINLKRVVKKIWQS